MDSTEDDEHDYEKKTVTYLRRGQIVWPGRRGRPNPSFLKPLCGVEEAEQERRPEKSMEPRGEERD